MVQQAELELVIRVREMRHRERLAIVAVPEDAHLFLEHDTLLLPPVRMEQAVKLGVGVAAMEVRGKRSQRRRRGRGGGAGVDQVVELVGVGVEEEEQE